MIELAKGCDIMVATPGRLIDLVEKDFINLKMVKYLIMDEADRMLDQNFYEDIKNIISHTTKRKERQNLLFSATFNDDIKGLAKYFLNNYYYFKPVLESPKQIKHDFIRVQNDEDKKNALISFLKKPETKDKSVLIFLRTKAGVDELGNIMKEENIPYSTIHGDKIQADRIKAINEFSAGKKNVLIATDVASRGLDFPNVYCVVNFDLPQTNDDYIHRVGRTGRVGQEGKALTFIDGMDETNRIKLVHFLKNQGQEVPEWIDDSISQKRYRFFGANKRKKDDDNEEKNGNKDEDNDGFKKPFKRKKLDENNNGNSTWGGNNDNNAGSSWDNDDKKESNTWGNNDNNNSGDGWDTSANNKANSNNVSWGSGENNKSNNKGGWDSNDGGNNNSGWNSNENSNSKWNNNSNNDSGWGSKDKININENNNSGWDTSDNNNNNNSSWDNTNNNNNSSWDNNNNNNSSWDNNNKNFNSDSSNFGGDSRGRGRGGRGRGRGGDRALLCVAGALLRKLRGADDRFSKGLSRPGRPGACGAVSGRPAPEPGGAPRDGGARRKSHRRDGTGDHEPVKQRKERRPACSLRRFKTTDRKFRSLSWTAF